MMRDPINDQVCERCDQRLGAHGAGSLVCPGSSLFIPSHEMRTIEGEQYEAAPTGGPDA